MKKCSSFFSVVLIVLVLLSFGSCKKTKDALTYNCDELATNFSTTYQAFLMNPTQENCEAFVEAAEDYLDHCATTLTPAQRQEYQDALDAVDCSDY
ncbi:MAG: hypothetical protein JXB24_10420 [Bacteroidales bacterium]|nr:hypothetical protein [Bacteroidales bacterium]